VSSRSEFEPVGSNQTVRVDVRVIAGPIVTFRRPCAPGGSARPFYRLKYSAAGAAAARAGVGFPTVAMFFLSRFAKRFGRQVETIASETMDRL